MPVWAGVNHLESSLAEMDLEVLVDKWNTSQPCALAVSANNKKAKNILGYIRKSAASRSREVVIPLVSPIQHC